MNLKTTDLPDGTPGKAYVLKLQQQYNKQPFPLKFESWMILLLAEKIQQLEEQLTRIQGIPGDQP